MQLIVGRTAQQFNIRKNRKCLYLEDRYRQFKQAIILFAA